MPQPKDTDWLNGYKNKTHIYSVYKKLTSDLKKCIDWKWEDGKIHSMQMGSKRKCENDYITKCNLQTQCDPYQITNGIFHKTRTKNFIIHMKTQKTLNSLSSLEKEECSWRNQFSYFRLYYKATVIMTVWH